MAYNWCHGPKCHKNHTQDRIRGNKGNKVLRTRKIKVNPNYANHSWQWFCSNHCERDFWGKYGNQIRQIAPRNEPLETPIDVRVEDRTDYFGRPFKQKVIVDRPSEDVVG